MSLPSGPRPRSEGFGTYDLGGLIFAAMAVLGLGAVGLGLLIAAAIRHGAGRSARGFFIWGVVLVLPALWLMSLIQ